MGEAEALRGEMKAAATARNFKQAQVCKRELEALHETRSKLHRQYVAQQTAEREKKTDQALVQLKRDCAALDKEVLAAVRVADFELAGKKQEEIGEQEKRYQKKQQERRKSEAALGKKKRRSELMNSGGAANMQAQQQAAATATLAAADCGGVGAGAAVGEVDVESNAVVRTTVEEEGEGPVE